MAPVDSSPARPLSGNYELICSLKANDLIPVHKYKSTVTGLTIVIAEVEGPVVNGYFCLATEAHDDDGLPHTLEHLIFLGSESYPYKGVLDLLANRCLASGTNAWTDTDHTCYTMTTAGSEGFLTLMPIYLDHILYPTLTDSAFITEVHHVTEEGEDAGVVYCEMQGRENMGESRTYLSMIRAVYPGHCGYKSETGGIMKNLRESTNNEKVRQYHREFYRPENLTLIITGQVKHDDVFRALAPVEDKITSKGGQGPFSRPWQSPVPALTESVDLRVPYPCDEEDNGMVYIAWRGPSAVKELYRMCACSVLLKYLTDTSVSPLQKEFVEIEDPYASKVCYSLAENSESMLYLMFENVPNDKLNFVKGRLTQILGALASGDEKLDMKRLRTVIHRQILESLSHLETSPHEGVAFMIIGDMLYGNTKEDLDHRLNQVEDLRIMENEPEEFWINLLKRYLVDAPSVTVRGIPSVEEQQAMAVGEKKRIEAQRNSLGTKGLEANGEKLKNATTENEKPPPEEMLTSVSIPSTASINFHPIQSCTSDSIEQNPKFDLKKIPVQMHLDNVHTNFVYMYVLMDTSCVSREMRPYLPVLLESLLELPIKRGDAVVPYEDVVAELEMDTVAAVTKIGLEGSSRFQCGPYSHTAALLLQLEPIKYERCITWIRELLYQTLFIPERLRIISAKIANDVAQVKRQGNNVVRDLMKGLAFNKDSNHYASSMLRQHQFLTSLIEKLDSEETQREVLDEIDQIRRLITNPENLVIHLATNIDQLVSKIGDPVKPWLNLLPGDSTVIKKKLSVTPDWTLLLPPADQTTNSCVVGLGCIESSFFCQTTRAIKDFSDPDLPSLLVFLQYLTQLEGPLWKQVRGLGLAYGYTMIPRPNEGLLYLSFYRATNCVLAYKEVKSIVDTHLSDGAKWDQTLFESAKSSLIFEIIEHEKSIGDVVNQSLLSYFKGVDHNYNRNLVNLIAQVSTDDLNRIGPKYVAPLFDPQKCKTSVVCHPSKAEEIASGFKDMNLALHIYQTLEDSFLNKW
ncbi:Presequence protease, mitochondrial [Gryllus bimaculatus]|nr:Presequence protease, mitochondrial [Gryllus bimaculatus]